MTSRGLFTNNNERFLKEKAQISSTPLCRDYQVYVQVMAKSPLWSSVTEHWLDRARMLLLIWFILKIVSWFVCIWFLQQETPDFVNSLSLKVEIEQQNADANPVLDRFSPNASEFFVSDWYSTTSCVTFFVNFKDLLEVDQVMGESERNSYCAEVCASLLWGCKKCCICWTSSYEPLQLESQKKNVFTQMSLLKYKEANYA